MNSKETTQRRIDVSRAGKIFTKYGDFIDRIIFSQVKNKTQADDIFQDFFLSLVHKPIPQDIKNMKGYLYKAIIRDIIDAKSRLGNYINHMHKYSAAHNHSTDKKKPENALIEVEETKIFKIIKEMLPNRQYQAVVLRYRTGLSLKEIAEEMVVKEESVRKYIYRGLRKIRQFVKQK